MKKAFFERYCWLCLCLVTSCKVLNTGSNNNGDSRQAWIVEAKLVAGVNVDRFELPMVADQPFTSFTDHHMGGFVDGADWLTGVVYRLNSRHAALRLRELLASSGFCENIKLFAADE